MKNKGLIVSAIIVSLLIIIAVVIVIIISNKEDSNTPEDTPDTPDTTSAPYSGIPFCLYGNNYTTNVKETYCYNEELNNVVETGEILIKINFTFQLDNKYYKINNIPKTVTPIINKGTYELIFVSPIDEAISTYNSLQSKIIEQVFNLIGNIINDDIRSKHNIENINEILYSASDLKIRFPILNIKYTDDCLLAYIYIQNIDDKLSIYSTDYKYNYINEDKICISFKERQELTETNNKLFLKQFEIEGRGGDECTSTIQMKNDINPIFVSNLYNNDYINFAIILSVLIKLKFYESIFRLNVNLSNLTIEYITDHGQVFKLPLFITSTSYCKGIYTFTDFKNDFLELCRINRDFVKFIIDLKEDHVSTINIYDKNYGWKIFKGSVPLYDDNEEIVYDNDNTNYKFNNIQEIIYPQ